MQIAHLEPARYFQSQLGSIGAISGCFSSCDSTSLSIPAWFDWRPPAHRWGGGEGAYFQSQLGSIGAGVAGARHHLRSHFQSQLGSIGAPSPPPATLSSRPFQSQLGSIGAQLGGYRPQP